MDIEPSILSKLVEIDRSINKADYEQALIKARSLYKRHSDCIAVRERYATMLADYAKYERPRNRKTLQKKAVQILRQLTQSLRGIPIGDAGDIRNEYYHHSGQYLKQYKLGVELVSLGYKSFYFSQGAGASHHAYELARKGQLKRSTNWAKVSITAWEKYIKIDPDYYYPQVNLAFAWGIVGNIGKLNMHLDLAQKLSGKPSSYFEFVETKRKVELLKLAQ